MNTKEMTGRLQDWQKQACETAKNVGQTTDTYIRENTWSTLALAALLGCILGYVLSTNRD